MEQLGQAPTGLKGYEDQGKMNILFLFIKDLQCPDGSVDPNGGPVRLPIIGPNLLALPHAVRCTLC